MKENVQLELIIIVIINSCGFVWLIDWGRVKKQYRLSYFLRVNFSRRLFWRSLCLASVFVDPNTHRQTHKTFFFFFSNCFSF